MRRWSLVAALMALLLLFHIGFTVPDGAPTTEPSTSTAEVTATATALSAAQAWSIAWADFIAPPVAAQGFGYVAIPVPTMVAVLASLHSTFANAVDVGTIDAAARTEGLNPLLLFAAIGAEQPWNLRAAYPSDWRAYYYPEVSVSELPQLVCACEGGLCRLWPQTRPTRVVLCRQPV